MSAKQDVVTMRDKNGKRKEQKRVLTMTMTETHSLFVGENLTSVVGKSKFAALRPAGILLSSKMPMCLSHVFLTPPGVNTETKSTHRL